MNENPFGITREEVLELAANKFVGTMFEESGIAERVEAIIEERVTNEIAIGLSTKVDAFLASEMTKLIEHEITPIDIWGESSGSPTTIKAVLAKRAKDFWEVKVDSNGKESSYGGTPRHKALMTQILQDEFAKAIKENAEVIVSEFKAALKSDATKLVTEHIDKLINVRTK
jgi:hypothetical protein